MKKLKLQAEQIWVDSFEAVSAERRRGTVNAPSGLIFHCGTMPDDTCGPVYCEPRPISLDGC